MDEWVGAGDADFMRKAKERMQSRLGGSKIVVLASHSTGLLRDICNRAIVLDRGRLMHAGDITESLKYYHELLAQLRAGKEPESEPIPVGDRKSTRLNSSHLCASRLPSSSCKTNKYS